MKLRRIEMLIQIATAVLVGLTLVLCFQVIGVIANSCYVGWRKGWQQSWTTRHYNE